MSLRIQNNVGALNAYNNLSANSAAVTKSMERLSSGYRINTAGDDAAGLGISERMRGQIRGLAQAQRNAQDGVSYVQTTEGNLSEAHSMLQRIRELAVQYKNSTLSSSDKLAIHSEVTQLRDEIERLGSNAQFNGINVLNSASGNVTFQVGSNDAQTITVANVSLGAQVNMASFCLSDATAIASIDTAINNVSSVRATFGAIQNRLEFAMNATSTYHENLVAAESRIRDVDMAQETVNFTKSQILQQAGQSMLAQANQAPQAVLSLLR
jgi:flagellin